MALDDYWKKRDFARTPEPRGGKATRRRAQTLRYVVQKHAARRLHYDFRLELDGVLLSWAVPKGPSCLPSEKRLAMQTEDHPLEYGGFEGVIPAGEYGGGTVMVWDQGSWEPIGDARAGYEKGHLNFVVHGEKLQGGFHLVRIRGRDTRRAASSEDGERAWLLIKQHDAAAIKNAEQEPVALWPESALSGRSLEQIAEAQDRVWHSKPKAGKAGKDGAAAKRSVKKAAPRGQFETLVAALIERLRMTNPDRVLYPEVGVTKRDLALFYVQVADRMFPYVKDRVLTLLRCPEGQTGSCFYQKHPKADFDGVIAVPSVEKGKPISFMAVTRPDGILGLVQMSALEVHVWGCRRDVLERADQLVFDLDPGPGVPWEDTVSAAEEVRDLLGHLGLQSFVKTTGGKGLHVVSPIERRTEWPAVKDFCHAVATHLSRVRPDRYVDNMAKRHRQGRIFVDYLRNAYGASAIAPYSSRNKANATVAVPVSWKDLHAGQVRPESFTVTNVAGWLRDRDPWAGYFDLRQSLAASAQRDLDKDGGTDPTKVGGGKPRSRAAKPRAGAR